MGMEMSDSTKVQKNENYTERVKTLGAIAGGTAGGIATVWGAKALLREPVKRTMVGALQNISSQNSVFREASIKALEQEGMKYVHLRTPLDMMFDDDVLAQAFKNKPSKIKETYRAIKEKITPKAFKNFQDKKMLSDLDAFGKGENACHIGGGVDKIFVNFDKASGTVFQEMGHSKNYRSKGLGKVLQALRHPMLKKIGLGIAFASAILIPPSKESNSQAGEEKGILNEGASFLKDNCVEIAGLSCLPTIAEEGLASIKASQIAKKVLSPEGCKTINKLNGKAWLTYLLGGAVLTAGVYVAKKVRDSLS